MQTVVSKDGTKIAYDKFGKGPALILVAGATGLRTSWGDLTDLLASHFTVYAYDRRGRGDSDDTLPYAVQREIEDIEAIINTMGGSANLYGISSGGALVLRAAVKLDGRIDRLAVYEVPYDSSQAGQNAWHEYRAKLKEALDADRRSDAVELFMKFVGMPKEMISNMKTGPTWQSMEAIAPTLAYDAECLGEDRVIATDRFGDMTAKALILDGGASTETMPFMRQTAEALAKAIPSSKHQILEGQNHNVDPKVIAPVLIEFFSQK